MRHFNSVRTNARAQARRLTGAMVTTKGMYVANRAMSKERPLYLLVQAAAPEQVDKACEWLQKVMSGQIVPEAAAALREYSNPAPPSSSYAPPGPPSGPVATAGPSSLGFDAKVLVGIEHSEAQGAGFSLIGKLFGQGGMYRSASHINVFNAIFALSVAFVLFFFSSFSL